MFPELGQNRGPESPGRGNSISILATHKALTGL